MIDILLSAIALVLVIEGILPFACPNCWRSIITKLITQPDRTLRLTGLACMCLGVGLLFLVHHGFL